MVRKTVFDRDEIISAAYQVVRNHGLDQLSARRVADELGSSTAPVYSNFANMEELALAAADVAIDKIMDYTRRPWTQNQFLNVGVGVMEFVYDCPRWYQALFMRELKDKDRGHRLLSGILADMGSNPDLADLPELERTILLKKMSLFTHGLAVHFNTAGAACHPRDELIALMIEVGDAMVADAKRRQPRSPEDAARFAQLFSHDHPNPEKD